jgi:hypothetical protein
MQTEEMYRHNEFILFAVVRHCWSEDSCCENKKICWLFVGLLRAQKKGLVKSVGWVEFASLFWAPFVLLAAFAEDRKSRKNQANSGCGVRHGSPPLWASH